MAKTYKNNSSGPIVVDGNTVAADASVTLNHYVHMTDIDLTADTDPTDLVLATGTVSKNTDGTETVTLDLEGANKVEVQVVSSAGKWEVYFNDTGNTAAIIPASGAFNKIIPSKLLKNMTLKAKDDSATCYYNVILEE